MRILVPLGTSLDSEVLVSADASSDSVFDDLFDALLDLVLVTGGDTSVLLLGQRVFECSLSANSSDNSGDGGGVFPDDPRWVGGNIEQRFGVFFLDLFSTVDENFLVNTDFSDSQTSVDSDLSQSLFLSDGESLSDGLYGFLSSNNSSLGDLDSTFDSVLTDDLSLMNSSVNLSSSDSNAFVYSSSSVDTSLGDDKSLSSTDTSVLSDGGLSSSDSVSVNLSSGMGDLNSSSGTSLVVNNGSFSDLDSWSLDNNWSTAELSSARLWSSNGNGFIVLDLDLFVFNLVSNNLFLGNLKLIVVSFAWQANLDFSFLGNDNLWSSDSFDSLGIHRFVLEGTFVVNLLVNLHLGLSIDSLNLDSEQVVSLFLDLLPFSVLGGNNVILLGDFIASAFLSGLSELGKSEFFLTDLNLVSQDNDSLLSGVQVVLVSGFVDGVSSFSSVGLNDVGPFDTLVASVDGIVLETFFINRPLDAVFLVTIDGVGGTVSLGDINFFFVRGKVFGLIELDVNWVSSITNYSMFVFFNVWDSCDNDLRSVFNNSLDIGVDVRFLNFVLVITVRGSLGNLVKFQKIVSQVFVLELD